MNNQTIYHVWLQQALGYGSDRILPIKQKYTFIEDFYRAPLKEKLGCTGFTQKQRKALAELSLDGAKEIVMQCKASGIDIISIGDALYPESLVNIQNPPAVLYVRGNAEALSAEVAIAIVGTRSATPYGRQTAAEFGYNLAASGVTIVSGGALGIDSCAHKGALRAGGINVCVLGCGLDYKYLQENSDMRRCIAVKGALASEYPPNYPPSRYTFPMRNRIISGLAKGVLVVEAGERSGSLITVDYALEQNRDVFAIPGSIASSVSQGTNKLIKMGAKPVTEAYDILEEYSYLLKGQSDKRTPFKNAAHDTFNFLSEEQYKPGNTAIRADKDESKSGAAPRNRSDGAVCKTDKVNNVEKEKEEKKCEEQAESRILTQDELASLSENARKILRVYKKEEKKLHIDTIVEKTSLSVGEIHAAVTELEMADLITSLAGRIYEINVDAE